MPFMVTAMLDVVKINLKSRNLNSDHILNDQPFHM